MSRACARTWSGGPSISTAESVADPGCSTTIRSTRSFQTATRCSTTTRVAPVFSRQRPTASRTSRTPAGSRLAVGSSSRIRPGPHREDAGERQPLLLPAGERRRRVVQRQLSQPDVVERFGHAGPDLRRGNGQVFRAERDVVAEAREHHLGLRVLLHQPGTAAPGPGRGAVDQQAAGLVRVLGRCRRRALRRRRPRSCRRAPRPGRGAAWTCRRPKVPAAAHAPRAGCPGPVR